MSATPPTAATTDVDPSVGKVVKTIEGLRSKVDKQAEQIADLKKANAELKSNGSRIKRIPKAKGGKGDKIVAEGAPATADSPAPAPPLSTPA